MRKKNTFDWIEFGFNLTSSMFFLNVGIMFVGSISLYTSLIAESGALKFINDPKFSPDNKELQAHKTKIYSGFPPHLDKEMSTPLIIDTKSIDALSNNIFVKGLKDSEYVIVKFIKNVLFDMISNNYAVINMVYSLFYKLPESLALCLSMYATPLLIFCMFFVNMALAGVYHLVHFTELFMSDDAEKKLFPMSVTESLKNNPLFAMANSFKNMQSLKVSNIVIAILYLIFLAFPMVMFICPSIVMIYSYLSPLFATFFNANTGKKYNIIEYAIDMLSYKRQLIMWLISLTLVRVVYMSLGIYDAFSCLASILVLAAFTRIYSQYLPPGCSKK